jgi:pyruvate,water dikinase
LASLEGNVIGDPIAPGNVTGRAKVLHSPYEKSLEPGEILVTKATEPAWTPIFINAAGVVLEVGGPLQHGAIIAKEYGISCASGVYDVQNIIKDGDLLEVDGSNGIVKIIG